MTRRKKERQEKERERQRKRNRKRGRPKKVQGERKRNIENKQKMPFCRGENRVFCLLEAKKGKEKKTKTIPKKINKEGLGPREVALGATSPDP